MLLFIFIISASIVGIGFPLIFIHLDNIEKAERVAAFKEFKANRAQDRLAIA